MEFNKDFGECSFQIFAERSHNLHFRHAEKASQINTASVKLQESLLKELLLQLEYVRDIITRCSNVRKLSAQRDEAYEQYRTAQKRYDDANGDFKGAAGIGAKLVVDKYREQFEKDNIVA
jgi:hypothetical protein